MSKKKCNLIIPDKKYEKEQKTMKRCSIELYLDTKSYNFKEVYKKLIQYCEENNCAYASMLHDQDYYTEMTFDSHKNLIGVAGDKKENHYHFLISFFKSVCINDFCLFVGIEDRWIKILRTDDDFNNMIVYCTHIKCENKTYYEPAKFDSNIKTYCQFLHDQALDKKQRGDIIDFAGELLHINKGKVNTFDYITSLHSEFGYDLINKYYRMLKDMLQDHNNGTEVIDKETQLIDKYRQTNYLQQLEKDKAIGNLVDSFGCTDLELSDGRIYTITRKQTYKKDKE